MKNKHNIQILVALKHLGNVAKKVKHFSFILSAVPTTLRELIAECVRSCLKSYNNRAKDAQKNTVTTEAQFVAMQEIGKFAFGMHYNENQVDERQAIATAVSAVQDGLVRIFQNDKELTNLDERITFVADDIFTFVKLTMLSGRMW